MINPWTVLGVKPGDTEADLARAYRRKMFDAHPDRGGDPAKAKLLAKIYEGFKGLLRDDGHGTKRIVLPTPRPIFRSGPQFVIHVTQGHGVSATFTSSTTSSGFYPPSW